MSTEQVLRDHLDRATSDVRGGPDLETAVRQGRRQRRQRRTGLAVGAVAVVATVGVGAGVLRAVTTDDPTPVAVEPPAAAPPATSDFVPGTSIDSRMAEVVAEHLPALPPPDDVYPSDSRTAGPLPDEEFTRAEDWQAVYTVGGSELLVIMAAPSEAGPPCRGCEKTSVPGGTLYRQTFTSGDPGHWYFGVYLVREDGSAVNAFESLTAPGEEAGQAQRQVSDAELAALAQDPRLTFPAR